MPWLIFSFFPIYYSPGDVSAMTPGGIRMGTPALTSRYVLSVCIFMLLSVLALQVAFLANRALAIEFALQFLTFCFVLQRFD